MLIKFYKEMFCKKEKEEEKCPYLQWVEEQEEVLKNIDKKRKDDRVSS